MTIESDFPDIEKDSEKFAASIQRNPRGLKVIVGAVIGKLVHKKDSWESGKEDILTTSKTSIQDKEY